MCDVVELGRLQVGLEVDFGTVLELHGGVRVEAASEVVDCLLQFGGAIALLDDKDTRQFLLQLHLDLSMRSRLFLNRSKTTLFPPTFGIYNYKHQQLTS